MKKVNTACVIDDDEIFLYWASKMLNEIDFSEHILVYKNGKEAIEGLKDLNQKGKRLPDVIFLDINMPIMNGWDFLQDFLKIPNNNPEGVLVYIVSSSIDQQDLEQAKQFDIVHNYILKPLSTEDLVKIKESLG